MATHREFDIVSRMVYGGLSPEVKAVVEHDLGYMLPYFEVTNGESHHPGRFPGSALHVRFLLYGDDIGDDEREITQGLVKAIGVNLATRDTSLEIFGEPGEAAEALRI
jgi:hypothetical protein